MSQCFSINRIKSCPDYFSVWSLSLFLSTRLGLVDDDKEPIPHYCLFRWVGFWPLNMSCCKPWYTMGGLVYLIDFNNTFNLTTLEFINLVFTHTQMCVSTHCILYTVYSRISRFEPNLSNMPVIFCSTGLGESTDYTVLTHIGYYYRWMGKNQIKCSLSRCKLNIY